ncbi:MAG TPA: hypothetical protein VE863_17300 [Pyrinomonadaceae bacterium]|jgi:hypothetical protein|nr:hypothetical protein [Pyrinomonadaceae bacterium]
MIEVTIKFLVAIFVMILAVIIGFGLWRLVEIPLRIWRDSTFDYVYVDDDGNARELGRSEREYMTSALFTNDDADHYIKPYYKSLNRDGHLRGYLRRRQLPRQVPVASANE